MPIWATTSVGDQPDLSLLHWRVMRFQRGDYEGDHLVGIDRSDMSGRVSQAIQSWDGETLIAITGSGRNYHLAPLPSPNAPPSDARYVLDAYLQRAGGGVTVTDVTDEYVSRSPAVQRALYAEREQ